MKRRSRGFLIVLAASAVTSLTLTGCSSGGASQSVPDKAPAKISGTVSLWDYWTDREAKVVQSLIDEFEKANPGVTVKVHSGQDDVKIAQVIASGGDVDVAWASTPLQLGTLCPSGGFKDLAPYIKRDKVDMSQFTDVARSLTSFEGVQCSMPGLADAYGLYYNPALLEAAGYSAPPKTLSELEAVALKLTSYNSDGSIKTLGFNPLMGFYQNRPEVYGPLAGAKWMNHGKSDLAEQSGWNELMTWQKKFVDKIGYQKLKAFTAGLGDEWSANNAFQTGQVAMIMDGEWRVAFIKDQAPNLKYATAPFPVIDSQPDLHGGGYGVVNVIGMGKNAKNPEAAWALIKYLTINTGALVKLENELANIPPTKEAMESKDLTLPDQFKTFLSIAASPNQATPPNTRIGHAPQDALLSAWVAYQSAGGDDPSSVLKKVDDTINGQLSLSKGP